MCSRKQARLVVREPPCLFTIFISLSLQWWILGSSEILLLLGKDLAFLQFYIDLILTIIDSISTCTCWSKDSHSNMWKSYEKMGILASVLVNIMFLGESIHFTVFTIHRTTKGLYKSIFPEAFETGVTFQFLWTQNQLYHRDDYTSKISDCLVKIEE